MVERTLSREIYRHEGKEFRSTRLEVGPDGVRMDTQDMGPVVEEFWGDSDYEFWVTVPPDAAALLLSALMRDRGEAQDTGEAAGMSRLFEILQERFGGNPRAVDDFRKFCEANAIPHEFDSWI